ncbi:hypothetical protein D3C78_1767400 [compost metagenome]
MLLSSKIEPYANRIVFGNLEALESVLYLDALSEIDLDQYKDQRIVVKGCGDIPVPVSAYVEVTNKLRPIAKSIMFGEPCSTVPIYKRKD